jgi:hypothetical protein
MFFLLCAAAAAACLMSFATLAQTAGPAPIRRLPVSPRALRSIGARLAEITAAKRFFVAIGMALVVQGWSSAGREG